MKKFFVLWFILILLCLLSIIVGRYEISISDIYKIILRTNEDEMMKNVFMNIRLPRTIFVVIAGGALALSGFIYQSVFHNPLVSPDILGVSSGASVGAISAILFVGSAGANIQIWAFVASILVVLIAIFLAKIMKGQRLYSLIIAGIIVGALANAVIMSLKYIADPNGELAVIDYWLMGSFHTISWQDVWTIVPVITIATTLLYVLRYSLQVITLGEEEAISLGISARKISIIVILCATILTSTIVSIVGVVSWIGLIVPHVSRIIFGSKFKENFTESILLGSIILLSADMIARTCFTAEIPISIVTSFLGGIGLIFFMIKANNKNGYYK